MHCDLQGFNWTRVLGFLNFSAQLLGLQAVEHDEHELTRLGLIQHHVSVNSARQREREGSEHKVITYIEYRAVSGVFQTIEPPPPLHPASVSSPRTKGGGHTRKSIFRKTPNIGLASYSIIPLRFRECNGSKRMHFGLYTVVLFLNNLWGLGTE